MKKLFAVAATAALMLAATSPALALDVDVSGDDNAVTAEGNDVQFNGTAQNFIGSIGDVTQTQDGSATADAVAVAGADGDSSANADAYAAAEVAQEQYFVVVQYNSAYNDF